MTPDHDDYDYGDDYITERERRLSKGVTWYGIAFLIVTFAGLLPLPSKQII